MFYREMNNLKAGFQIPKQKVVQSKEHQYEKCKELARVRIDD